jgi:tripartite-type tricarboxylate transporter receptor subunit TctC
MCRAHRSELDALPDERIPKSLPSTWVACQPTCRSSWRAAPADGYTLLLLNSSAAVSATLYEKLNFDVVRDIAPVASISREANVMVVPPSVPAKSVPEFIAYAKANPGKINMASPGNGTEPHLAGELFKMMTGLNSIWCTSPIAAGHPR